jgi:drug/metabolite transporter (DMT)-like permease
MSLNPLDYLRAMFNPYVSLGIVLLVLWLLTRMTLLSWADLSFVLPVTAAGYILTVALAYWFLKETVTSAQWLGALLISLGTGIVGGTSPKTTQVEGGAR